MHNFKEDSQIFIFTDSDLDGTGCRIVFEHYLKNYTNFVIKQTTVKDVNDLLALTEISNSLILFSDLVPDVEQYQRLSQNNNIIYLFDHHQTSYDRLKDIALENYYYSTEYCATKVVYDFFSKGKRINKCLHEFVELVNVYDTWQEDDDRFFTALGINSILWREVASRKNKLVAEYYGMDEFVRRQLKKIVSFTQEGYILFDDEQKYIQEKRAKIIDTADKIQNKLTIFTDSAGLKYGYFEMPSMISILASLILKNLPELDYLIAQNTYKVEGAPPGVKRFSIRSKRDNLDVSKIAIALNKLGSGTGDGGGHQKAAGFNMTDLNVLEQIRTGNLQYTI